MIRKSYPWLLFLVGISFGLIASNRLIVRAQDRQELHLLRRADRLPPGSLPIQIAPQSRWVVPPHPSWRKTTPNNSPTVQDVLLRPYHFPFSRPTSLLQVSAHLKQTLKVPVVLDIAALARQEVDPDDTVQLELDGVRLKTGLKLLLDQVDLTYHVVAEDNLLIITDRQGSEEPLDRVWNEMKAMHREIHDLQDALDQLMDSLVVEKGDGSRVRKPTIIEEMPDNEGPKPQDSREKPEESAKKPKGERRPDPAPRSPTSRVPLIGPGRPL